MHLSTGTGLCGGPVGLEWPDRAQQTCHIALGNTWRGSLGEPTDLLLFRLCDSIHTNLEEKRKA